MDLIIPYGDYKLSLSVDRIIIWNDDPRKSVINLVGKRTLYDIVLFCYSKHKIEIFFKFNVVAPTKKCHELQCLKYYEKQLNIFINDNSST